MKALLSTLVFVIGLSVAFGQDNVAVVKSKSDLTSIKVSGKGMMTLPAHLTSDQVQSKAKYYTHYFTVDFDASSHVAKISMVDNDERSRAVIMRFLAACDVETIQVEGESVARDALYEKYLK